MKRMKVLSLIMAVALVIGMLPAFAVSANAASTKVYQANNTDETVLTVYQVRDNLVDNQNGYSTLQNGKAMAQDGFMDKNRALSVTWMVQADEAGTYTFDPLYCIGHFGALKNGIYNMVWCVNDTYYYLGADITSSTIGTHMVSHGMDIVELPLEKGVNIVRMLPIAGPHYEYQKVDRGDGTVVASYINIYKVGIDSRLAVRKSEPLKISMEKADRNANQFITNQFSLVDTDYGFAASGSSYVKNNYATLPNFETLNQSNLSTMPYVSYTLNAPEDGWYDMTLNLSVATASQYGNDGYLIVRVNGQNYKRWIHAQNTTDPHKTSAQWPFSDQNISVPLKKGDNAVTVTCVMGMKGGANAASYEKSSGGYCAYTRISSMTVYGGVTLSSQKINPTTIADVQPKTTTLQAETYGAGWKYASSGTVMKSEDLSAAADLPSMAALWQGGWFDRAAVPAVSFAVNAPATGVYRVKAVYNLTPADGADALNYAITASVNDEYYDKARFEPQTALSRTAGYSDLVVELEKGMNVIRIMPVLNGMPAKALDLDYITVTGDSAVSGILPQQLELKSAEAQYRNVLSVSGDVLTGNTGAVTHYGDLNMSNLAQTGWFAYTVDVPADGYYDLQVEVAGAEGSLALVIDGKKREIPVSAADDPSANPANVSAWLTAGEHTILITGILGKDTTLGTLTLGGGITKAAVQKDPLNLGVQPDEKEGGLVPGSVYAEEEYQLTGIPENTTGAQFKSNFLDSETVAFLKADGTTLADDDIVTADCGVLYPNGSFYKVSEVLTGKSQRSIGADQILALGNPVGRLIKEKNAVRMEMSMSAITLTGNLEGDVKVTLDCDAKMTEIHSFYVEVDGKLSYFEVPAGRTVLTVAENLAAGNHTIKIHKGTDNKKEVFYIHSVAYTGTLEKAASATRRIEFLGDSITAGSGVFFEDCNYGYTQSWFVYANMVADAFGADHYSVANGGWRFHSTVGASTSIATIYDDVSMHDASLGAYDFSWKPDVVVINLGTNDAIAYRGDKTNYTEASFKENIRIMLNLVREKNPDAEIVWVYGTMLTECKAWIQQAVEEYGNTDTKVHYVYAPGNTDGRGDHPDFDGHTKVAGALTEALSDIMGWQLPTGTHATGDCDSATCEFCIRNELTLPLHTYADDCDTTCNYVMSDGKPCEHKRVAPHTFADCTDTTCENCSATRTAEAEHAYTDACDVSCNNEGCGYERTDAAMHTYDGCTDASCNVCGAAREAEAEHAYSGACDASCNNEGCGYERTEVAAHTYSDCTDASCNVCSATRTANAEHAYSGACDASCNNEGCGYERTDVATHTYDDCTDASCNVCGATRTAKAEHAHSGACDASCNNEGCGYERTDVAAHTYDDCTDASCNVCGATRDAEAEHAYSGDCDASCNNEGCSAVRDDVANHTYDDWADTSCNVCGANRTTDTEHTYSGDCDATCNNEGCGYERTDVAAHTYSDCTDASCNVCSATRTANAEHAYSGDCDASCNNEGCGYERTEVAAHTYSDCTEASCNVCSATRTANAEHAYSGACDASCNNEGCGYERTDVAAHTYSDCTDAACNICGAGRTAKAEHAYSGACDASCNNEGCGAVRTDVAAHTYDDCTDAACNICGATRTANAEHAYSGACDASCNNEGCGYERTDAAAHTRTDCDDTECNVCGAALQAVAHSGGTATCKQKAVCTACGKAYGELAKHTYRNGACTVCGASDPNYKPAVNPSTGDEVPLVWLFVALLASGAALIVFRKKYI